MSGEMSWLEPMAEAFAVVVEVHQRLWIAIPTENIKETAAWLTKGADKQAAINLVVRKVHAGRPAEAVVLHSMPMLRNRLLILRAWTTRRHGPGRPDIVDEALDRLKEQDTLVRLLAPASSVETSFNTRIT